MVGKPVTQLQPGRENAFLKLKVTVTLELKWVCEGQQKEGQGEWGLTLWGLASGFPWVSLI